MILHPNEIKQQVQQVPHAERTINQSVAHRVFWCIVGVAGLSPFLGGAPDFGGGAPDFGGGAPDFGGGAPDFGGGAPGSGGGAPDFGGGEPAFDGRGGHGYVHVSAWTLGIVFSSRQTTNFILKSYVTIVYNWHKSMAGIVCQNVWNSVISKIGSE